MGPTVNGTIHYVPYASHGILEPSNMCALTTFAKVLGLITTVDYSCLPTSNPQPDWEGHSQVSSPGQNSVSKTFFGTDDLWNNGGPNPDSTSTSSVIVS